MNRDFGEFLKQLRTKSGFLSQKSLADRINVSAKAVSKWENGHGLPDIGNLKALADCFSVSIDELYAAGATLQSTPQPASPTAPASAPVSITPMPPPSYIPPSAAPMPAPAPVYTVPPSYHTQPAAVAAPASKNIARKGLLIALCSTLSAICLILAIGLPFLFIKPNSNPGSNPSGNPDGDSGPVISEYNLYTLDKLTVKVIMQSAYDIDPASDSAHEDANYSLAMMYTGKTVSLTDNTIAFGSFTILGANGALSYAMHGDSLVIDDAETRSQVESIKLKDGKLIVSVNYLLAAYIYEFSAD